jgi:hypothetical protein
VTRTDTGTDARPTVTLRHNKIDLALHRLRDGEGRPLLHLHGLAERSPAAVVDAVRWGRPVAREQSD